jgi:hypothetical protein
MSKYETNPKQVGLILREIAQGKHDGSILKAKAWSPYDGCFWLWVVALIDRGKIIWANDPRHYGNYKWKETDSNREVLLNLGEIHFVTDFKEDIPGSYVQGLLKLAEQNDIEWFTFPCKVCGIELIDPSQTFYLEEDYHSEGGITWVAGDPVCCECFTRLEYEEDEEYDEDE